MHLKKATIVRWLLDGNRVPAKTPGAKKVKLKARYWTIVWVQDGRRRTAATKTTDRRVAEARMAALRRKMELGQAGLLDPTEEHRGREINAHLEEFLPVFRAETTNPKYARETERILRTTLEKCAVKTLGDLDLGRFEDFLSGLDRAPATRKKYHSAMSLFCRWLHRRGRIQENFLLRLESPRGGSKVAFRPFAVEELQKLLDVARTRFLDVAGTVQGGPARGKPARIRPEVRERLTRQGNARAMWYKFAALTALRQNTTGLIKVCYIEADHKPFPLLHLPGDTMKSRRGEKLLLLPSLVEELLAWCQVEKKGPNDFLFRIPSKPNVVFDNDLVAAGIPKKTDKGVACFRSFRKSANVLLRQMGVSLKARQLFLHHSDIRLTGDIYDSGDLDDLAEVLPALSRLGLK